MTNIKTIRAAREIAGLSCKEAARLIGVAEHMWQRWEGQSEQKTEMPLAYLELFLLKTGKHPTHIMVEREE
jgi:DNA-binding transcriptional regulator YiaG